MAKCPSESWEQYQGNHDAEVYISACEVLVERAGFQLGQCDFSEAGRIGFAESADSDVGEPFIWVSIPSYLEEPGWDKAEALIRLAHRCFFAKEGVSLLRLLNYKGMNELAYLAPVDFMGEVNKKQAIFPEFEGAEAVKNKAGQLAVGFVDLTQIPPGYYFWTQCSKPTAGRLPKGFFKWDGVSMSCKTVDVIEIQVQMLKDIVPDLPDIKSGMARDDEWAEAVRMMSLFKLRQQGYWTVASDLKVDALATEPEEWIKASLQNTHAEMVMQSQGWKYEGIGFIQVIGKDVYRELERDDEGYRAAMESLGEFDED